MEQYSKELEDIRVFLFEPNKDILGHDFDWFVKNSIKELAFKIRLETAKKSILKWAKTELPEHYVMCRHMGDGGLTFTAFNVSDDQRKDITSLIREAIAIIDPHQEFDFCADCKNEEVTREFYSAYKTMEE